MIDLKISAEDLLVLHDAFSKQEFENFEKTEEETEQELPSNTSFHFFILFEKVFAFLDFHDLDFNFNFKKVSVSLLSHKFNQKISLKLSELAVSYSSHEFNKQISCNFNEILLLSQNCNFS